DIYGNYKPKNSNISKSRVPDILNVDTNQEISKKFVFADDWDREFVLGWDFV
ncbi:9517_t:CDS:1, partial [Cetraspora pellucida]